MDTWQSVTKIWGWLRATRARTLLYHSLSDAPLDPLAVPPGLFVQHMEWLARNGCSVISSDALVRAIREGHDLAKTVVLTFDDAFRDFYEVAMPVLTRCGFPATVFVATGRIGQSSDWGVLSPARPLMNEDELLKVASSGHELGSHTVTHVSLPSIDDATLRRELAESLSYLRSLTRRDRIPFAYPYGRCGPREHAAVGAAGYASAYLAGGLWGNGSGSDVLALTRDLVGRDTSLPQFVRLVRGETDVRRLVQDLARRRGRTA
jgi:peptidoglycan/xylan/chitin deacetylase (PgdA/CDA1 family)